MDAYNPNFKGENNFALVGVKGVIRDGLGRILILKRSDKVEGVGKWSLPGGYIIKGESPEEALKREITEETGLSIYKLRLCGVKTLTHKGSFFVVIGFSCMVKKTIVTLNWENSEYKWIEENEIGKSGLSVYSKYFLKRSGGIC